MLWLVPVLVTIAVTTAVAVVVVYLISRQVLKQVAREKARKAVELKIRKCLERGDYNEVHIGLYDRYGCETQQITVRGETVEKDFYQGERIALA